MGMRGHRSKHRLRGFPRVSGGTTSGAILFADARHDDPSKNPFCKKAYFEQ